MPVDQEASALQIDFLDESSRHERHQARSCRSLIPDFEDIGCAGLYQSHDLSQRLSIQRFHLQAYQVVPKVTVTDWRRDGRTGDSDFSAPQSECFFPARNPGQPDGEPVAVGLPLQDAVRGPRATRCRADPPLLVTEDILLRSAEGTNACPTLDPESAPDLSEDERRFKHRVSFEQARRCERRWNR